MVAPLRLRQQKGAAPHTMGEGRAPVHWPTPMNTMG